MAQLEEFSEAQEKQDEGFWRVTFRGRRLCYRVGPFSSGEFPLMSREKEKEEREEEEEEG